MEGASICVLPWERVVGRSSKIFTLCLSFLFCNWVTLNGSFSLSLSVTASPSQSPSISSTYLPTLSPIAHSPAIPLHSQAGLIHRDSVILSYFTPTDTTRCWSCAGVQRLLQIIPWKLLRCTLPPPRLFPSADSTVLFWDFSSLDNKAAAQV